MVAPTQAVRDVVFAREEYRCIRCGRVLPLEFQHRRAVGMGGSRRPVACTDGLAACSWCNEGFEAALQTEALVYGWKVPRWVKDPASVPVFNRTRRLWARLTVTGGLLLLQPTEAIEAMRSVYGAEWDRWVDALEARTGPLVGMTGRTAR